MEKGGINSLVRLIFLCLRSASCVLSELISKYLPWIIVSRDEAI